MSNALDAATSFISMAATTFLIAVLREDFLAWLRNWRFAVCKTRFFADLIFGIIDQSRSKILDNFFNFACFYTFCADFCAMNMVTRVACNSVANSMNVWIYPTLYSIICVTY